MTAPRVAVVAVSHSAGLAAGVAELAAQMAPDVTVIGVGGSDGGLGTSFEAITDALNRAGADGDVVVLYDLGSARLTSDAALELLDPELAGRVEIVDAPLVEGAVAAAVTAEGGADREEVAAAARAAAAADHAVGEGVAAGNGAAAENGAAGQAEGPALTRSVPLRNPLGLHARPVAELIREVAGLDAQVRIGRGGQPAVELRSMLSVVSLALRGGETAEISAWGPDAGAALDRVAGLIEAGFGEAGPPGGPGPEGPGQSAARQPAVARPGAAEPGTAEPGTAEPGTAEPGTAEPGTAEPGTGQPGAGQPGTGQPGAGQPGAGQPGAGELRAAQPGAERAAGQPQAERPRMERSQAETAQGQAPARGAPGRAIGPAVRVAVPDIPQRAGAGAERERARLRVALDAATGRLAGGDPMSRAHAALLADPQLWTAAEPGLAGGLAAEPAWWHAVTVLAGQLAASPDELVAARAADVREAGAAVLTELGADVDRIPPAAELSGAVLVADELGPGEVARAAERGAVAIALSRGSPTAHAVLVGRNLGLPMVLGLGRELDRLRPGAMLDVDGTAGTVQADPPDLEERQRAVAATARQRDRERELAAAPVRFRGRPIRVAANIGSVAEARSAVAAGADGVGLLRTELLMLDRPELPDEDAQAAQLTAIFEVLGNRPVVVRVLDLGGDKPMRALALDPQHNGFLGVRGLRWLLRHPGALRTQLRAICRAAPGHQVEVMAPMVTLAREAVAFREAVDAAAGSLAAEGIPHIRPARVGVMIEVPAAALAADEIGAEVDFVSVGTNDLVAYTMAADRAEPDLAPLADPSATALWRLLEQVCAGAAASRADVSVCGELAADGRFAVRLVELGVTELSMAAGRIPAVKALLRAG